MRDLTDKQFATAMNAAGWKKPEYGFLGYWEHRSGLHASVWNYRTNRQALAAMSKMGEEHDRRSPHQPAQQLPQAPPRQQG